MAIQKDTENRMVLEVPAADEKGKFAKLAELYAAPSVSAALMQLESNPQSGLDLMACIAEMQGQIKSVHDGDLKRVEAMLISQAHALQAIFTRFATRMLNNEYLNQIKVSGTIAFKAQAQCRQTLAVLAEIKNPKRATFIKNQATNQQINLNSGGRNLEKNTPISSNELLSEAGHAPMDTERTAAATGANTAMAALENSRCQNP